MTPRVRKVVGSSLVAFAGLVYTTFIVTHVADELSQFSADRKEANELRLELGNDVVRLTTDEADELNLLARDLLPQAQLRLRCDQRSLPPALVPQSGEICAEAAKQEILEEQARDINAQKLHREGELLQRQLAASLDDPRPAVSYERLLGALNDVARLNTSTTCGADRRVVADRIAAAYDWFGPDLKEPLIGPGAPGSPRCDDRGAGYAAAAEFTLRMLTFEGGVVATEIGESGVRNQSDSTWKLGRAILDPVTLVLAALAAALAVGGWLLQRRPPEQLAKEVPPRANGAE